MQNFSISIGTNARDQFWKTKNFADEQDFFEQMFSGFRYGPKDGACIISGNLAGGDRGSNLVIANSLIMLDHDNGITFEDVVEKIKAVGLRAVVWTTHSHRKNTTDLGQGGITAHKKKKRFGDDVAAVEVVRDYLKERKQWTPEMLASIESAEDFMDPKKGMQVRVTHAPMPKVRSLFFLEKPFTFTEPNQSQKDRIAEWKDRLKGFANRLDLPFDSACQDPAHLMYLPACKDAETEETNGHEIRAIDGASAGLLFDFVRYTETADVKDVRVAADVLPRTFRTAGLGTFIRRGGPAETFRAADWYRDLSGQEPRRIADSKITFECPNDAEHSNAGDPKDTAFFTQDAEVSTGQKWMLHCRHDSCISRFANDRARLLDFACEQFGITDAHDLLPYTDSESLTEGDGSPDDTDYDALGDVDALIADVKEQTPTDVVDQIVRYLARFPAPSLLAQERRLKTLGQKSKLGTRAITNAVKAAQAILPAPARQDEQIPGAPQADGEEVFRDAPPPPENGADTRTIWKEWAYTDKIRVLREALEAANEAHKHIFSQPDGTIVKVRTTEVGISFIEIRDSSQWLVVCHELGLQFRTTGADSAVAPFPELIKYLAGGTALTLPIIERAVGVPVFGADGSLQTEKGYHAGSRVYLNPSTEFLDVPDPVSSEDVREALDVIGEVIYDFPFSDVFVGVDPEPVRIGAAEDKQANWVRGKASRANFVAMLLQPFARGLIGDNATPLYFIDKSEKGTGANYLANVLGYMMYGTPMPPQVASEREEELEKAITASLYEGSPTIFLDNLNHELSSAALASALTSGVWTGRILGKSHVPKIPVRAVWILAANNGKISEELMRRVVPIRLDAALPNPAIDRPRDYYRIKDLPTYCLEHRKNLVWAAHVLIRNYVHFATYDPASLEEARRDFPYPTMQSFYRWAEVMGDILACAGVEGFLGNVSDYLADKQDDRDSGAQAYFNALWKEYQGNSFSVPEALTVLQEVDPTTPGADGDNPHPRFGFYFRNIQKDNVGGKVQYLGMHLTRCVGRAYAVEDDVGVLQLSKIKKGRNGSRYKLTYAGPITPTPPRGAVLGAENVYGPKD